MQNHKIQEAALQFVHLMEQQPEETLASSWSWGSYSSEGIRFAFFRTYEELVELAATIKSGRANQGPKITQAQHILSGYQSAYRDLQAVLSSASSDILEQPPAEDSWSIRRTLNHIVAGDIGFYGVTKYALDRHRLQDWHPEEMTDSDWDDVTGLTEEKYKALFKFDLSTLTAFHVNLHEKIIADFSGIQDHELEQPAVYWEDAPMPIQFRLLRFESHMRQHTIQIEKTIVVISGAPNETHRLIRLVYAGLAAVESACIGAPESSSLAQQKAAQTISARTAELKDLLARG